MTACRTARMSRKIKAQRCSVDKQHRVFFTWNHSEFKVWVVMKLVPYHGILVKEYLGEILKSFDKFQVVPSSMEVFTINLNGPLAPMVTRLSEGRAGRDTVGTGWQCLGCTSWVRKIEHWCWANLSVSNKLWVGLKEFTPLFCIRQPCG